MKWFIGLFALFMLVCVFITIWVFNLNPSDNRDVLMMLVEAFWIPCISVFAIGTLILTPITLLSK